MSSNATAEKDKDFKLKFNNVSVIKEGQQIVIPKQMSNKEACVWLIRDDEANEKKVAIHTEIKCFPMDGIIALRRALEERYGHTIVSDTPGFFGPTPPLLIQVELSDGTYETAVLGRLSPPMYEGGFLDTSPKPMSLVVSGEVKRKHEQEVKQILERMKEMLSVKSIYKGKAVILDLSWMDEVQAGNIKWNPFDHAPKFMNVSNVSERGLILNRQTMSSLQSNIWTLIERSDACRANDIPLKHGCLLAGDFGTGKTLSAYVTAEKAVRNGWTFIYLKTTKDLAKALKLAEMYAPAVLFAEDIDEVVGVERDEEVNEILNTLDGVDTKSKPIITVLTTNNVESISPAFLRAGRIDTLIVFQRPDADSAYRLVQLYSKDDDGKSLLAVISDEDAKRVGEAFKEVIPAFVSEAVQKAKRLALGRNVIGDDNITGKVMADDLIDSVRESEDQRRRVEGKKPITDEQRTHAAWQHLHRGEPLALASSNGTH